MDHLAIVEALGGARVFGAGLLSAIDVVKRVEDGVPMTALAAFMKSSGLSRDDLATVIPKHTLTNRKGSQRLPRNHSDKLVRIAEMVHTAERVLGDREAARTWLTTPLDVFGGQTPIRLLRTGAGESVVRSALARIERGERPHGTEDLGGSE